MPACAIISFRLGQSDGVSVVARLWQQILNNLGFETYTIAGEGNADLILPGLARHATNPPTEAEIREALAASELTLVENIGSIPMNLPASLKLLQALQGRHAIMHHHDPPWQRQQWAHVTELPGADPAWRHLVINDITQAQMSARGFEATRIYNPFDCSPQPGDRALGRRLLGVREDELLVLHPVRAIRRKDVPAALRIAEKLDGTYWLAGPAEDGYGPILEQILRQAKCRVISPAAASGLPQDRLNMTTSDMYATADLVVYPSWWEGFGNPPAEAAIHGLPVVVGDYPVAQELRQLGFKWYYPWEISAVASFLAAPDQQLLEHNRALAERHFSLAVIQSQVKDCLVRWGWL